MGADYVLDERATVLRETELRRHVVDDATHDAFRGHLVTVVVHTVELHQGQLNAHLEFFVFHGKVIDDTVSDFCQFTRHHYVLRSTAT